MNNKDCFFIVCILVMMLVGLVSIPVGHAVTPSHNDGFVGVHLLSFQDDGQTVYSGDFDRYYNVNRGILEQVMMKIGIYE